MATLTLINTRVSPHIEVRATLTTSSKLLSSNAFYDPEDGEMFRKEGLSPIEKGHYYRCSKMSDNTVHICTPYRVFDGETHAVVRGLKTLTPMLPFSLDAGTEEVYIRSGKKQSLPATYIAQNFKVSLSDFLVLKTLAKTAGWVLDELGPNYDAVRDTLVAFKEKSKEFNDKYAAVCNRIGGDPAKVFAAGEIAMQNLLAAIEELQDLKTQAEDTMLDAASTFTELSRMRTDPLRMSNLQESITRCRDESLYPEIDLQGLVGQARHIFLMYQGAPIVPKSGLPPLQQELSRLARFYPSLRFASSNYDNNLVISLMGAKIIITDKEVTVEGSLNAFVKTDKVEKVLDGTSARLAAVNRTRGQSD